MSPLLLPYRTRRRTIGESLQARIDRAEQSPELLQVVEKAREARRRISSLSERVLMTSEYSTQSPSWNHSLRVQGANFKMSGDGKFLGVVDGIMRSPLRVGSDGRMCWFRVADVDGTDTRVDLPFVDISEKNLLFCDPFSARGPDDVARVIRDLRLEYAGETDVLGRRCHRIRSWKAPTGEWGDLAPTQEWFVDAETFLPMRHELLVQGRIAMEFAYSRINEPIPDEEFRPDAGPGIRVLPPKPLDSGYTRHFLDVIDGSTGRISVRWGMKGNGGRTAAG